MTRHFKGGGLTGGLKIVGADGTTATAKTASTTTTSTSSSKRDLHPPTLWDRRRYIHFYGEAFSNAGINRSFDVLSGDQPPTIVDGYAQWATIQRPLRTGLVVYTGRNPIAMQVSVRFMQFDRSGSWLTDEDAGIDVEKQIEILEWMGGESIEIGPSPLVYLSTYDPAGNTTALIPFEYQSGTPSVPSVFNDLYYSPRWVMTGLSWDAAPVRTPNGSRIRQDATVTVTMYEAPAGSPSRGVPRAKASTVISHAGADTPMKIARSKASQDPYKLAEAIIKASQNKKLHLRYVNQKIKHGKKVYVPPSSSSS